jgi:hypothetical protein
LIVWLLRGHLGAFQNLPANMEPSL